jgi:hypothetical protein
MHTIAAKALIIILAAAAVGGGVVFSRLQNKTVAKPVSFWASPSLSWLSLPLSILPFRKANYFRFAPKAAIREMGLLQCEGRRSGPIIGQQLGFGL